MLQTFYNSFGFAGALITVFLLFVFIVFWVAGVAGICMTENNGVENNSKQNAKMLLAVLIPPYPFLWMIWEIYTQKKQLQEAD